MYSAMSTLDVRNSVTQSSYLSAKLSRSEGSPVPQTYGTSRWLATLALPCAYLRPAGSSIFR